MTKPILSNLTHAKGSRKRVKRIGRGQGSGHGGTATRGHKGEGARSGTHNRPWFEGGQMPLVRRVPKFGFHSPFRVSYQVVNLDDLAKAVVSGKLQGKGITPATLYASGLVGKKTQPVKVLGTGEITQAVEVSAHAFSGTATKKIESAGGRTTVLNRTSR
ncbi:MAG TPA: 50S ribosomal protein L15 [Bacteroidota bacterium]|nr:50S ribosomal protein L15 [Bacteroidota bacterium]